METVKDRYELAVAATVRQREREGQPVSREQAERIYVGVLQSLHGSDFLNFLPKESN
jgi:hypothetical protein